MTISIAKLNMITYTPFRVLLLTENYFMTYKLNHYILKFIFYKKISYQKTFLASYNSL